MTTATVPETIERVFRPIQQFTRGWMMAEATYDYGVEIGMRTGREFWVVGRAGVLGSCHPDIAVGALAFHGAEDVHEAWTHLPPGLTHYEISELYLGRITAWGEEALAGFDPDRMERLDYRVLAARVLHAYDKVAGLE